MLLFKKILKRNRSIYFFFRSARTQVRAFLSGLWHIDRTAYLGPCSWLSRDIIVGKYAYIGQECMIGPRVTVGPYAMIGPRVAVVGKDHEFRLPGTPIIFSGRPVLPKTVFEADTWIGCGAIIISGVTIGRGAIVAAGAVVSQDVPPYAIVGGVPARLISWRFLNDEEREKHDAMLCEEPQAGSFPIDLE